MNKFKYKYGLSLTELLISLTITSIVITGVFRISILIARNATEISRSTKAKSELAVFTQNLKILVFDTFEGHFRVDSNNTGLPIPQNEIRPTTNFSSMNSVYLRFSSQRIDLYENWGKITYDPNKKTIFWVKQISSSDTNTSNRSNEIWIPILNNFVRSDYQDDSNQGDDPVFRLIFNMADYPISNSNATYGLTAYSENDFLGIIIKGKKLILPSQHHSAENNSIYVESAANFANINI